MAKPVRSNRPPPKDVVPTRAVYPGSFDPLTNGHLDLVERSLGIFDELIVAVVTNPAKTALFSDAERVEMIREATQNFGRIQIMAFEGLLVDFVARVGARAIVRGLRAVSDFEYEFQMALMNRKLREEIETVFLMPHEAYSYLSSRLVKEVAGYGGAVTGLVPAAVEKRLVAKFARG
jgi:pantetheine-phosphate adenylyltransferase